MTKKRNKNSLILCIITFIFVLTFPACLSDKQTKNQQRNKNITEKNEAIIKNKEQQKISSGKYSDNKNNDKIKTASVSVAPKASQTLSGPKSSNIQKNQNIQKKKVSSSEQKVNAVQKIQVEKHKVKQILLVDIPDSKLKKDLLKLDKKSLDLALSSLNTIGKKAVQNDIASLNVDKSGGIFYECQAKLPDNLEISEKYEAPIPNGDTQLYSPVPITNPPIRHSKPGSSNVLYLDFNGGIVSNTAWNVSKGVAYWDCKPYDLDGDDTTFSDDEQAKIILFWEFVAEDYAPFDVDITTEEPAVYPAQTVGWCMITEGTDKRGTNCPHSASGGIAYLNVFGAADYAYKSPAWVKEYSSTYTAETCSHELGHNMGLTHDGDSTQEYYPGHDNGVIFWNAIMGGGVTPDVSQWCKGEYYDANNTQDDLSVIDGKLGYRTDDHGNYKTNATILNVVDANVNDSGYIETTGDPDVFKFTAVNGPITLNARPYKATSGPWGANLDILLELQDESGTTVASNNPMKDVVASISTTVSNGTYYLYVQPTGVGDPMNSTPTGFTIYGSLGTYSLSGTIETATEAASVRYNSHISEDDNGNGCIETGETANLIVELRNFGEETATNVIMTLTNVSSFLTVSSSTRPYGNIAMGVKATNSSFFSVLVATNCPLGNHELKTIIHADNGDWTSTFNIVVSEVGAMDHFGWNTIKSPQSQNVPFDVTVTAMDSNNYTVLGYTNNVVLSGWHGQETTNTILGDDSSFSILNGPSTFGYSFVPYTNMIVTHLRYYFGNKVSIWKDDGTLIVSKTGVATDGSWQETALDSPIELLSGTVYRVGAYSSSAKSYYKNVAAAFPHGTKIANYYSFSDSMPATENAGYKWFWVGLRYTAGLFPVEISPSNSDNFVNGQWNGSLSVPVIISNMFLKADDRENHIGVSDRFDVEYLASSTPYIQYDSYFATETGDGNGAIPGGTAMLRVWLKNIGGGSATNVGATLTNVSTYLTVNSPSRLYGNIISGGLASNALLYSVEIATNCPAGNHKLNTFISADNGGWTSSFNLVVNEVGTLDHFNWNTINSPQNLNVPFNSTIKAKDNNNYTVTSFSNRVTLSGWSGNQSTNTIQGNDNSFSSLTGPSTFGYSFIPYTDMTVTHLRYYTGSKVSIWKDNGELVVSKTGTSTYGSWKEIALDTPVVLSSGIVYRVGVYGSTTSFYKNVDAAFSSGTKITNYYSFSDSMPTIENAGYKWFWVGLRFTVGPFPVRISPTNSYDFVNGQWSNEITVHESVSNMFLKADDGNNHLGISGRFNVEFADVLPFIKITNAPITLAFNQTTTDIGGTNFMIAGSMAWIDDSEATNWFARSGNAWSTSVTGLENGANVITVIGTNIYGNITNDSITITCDLPDSWFETKINFCGYNRDETLTNFPVLVPLSTNIGNFLYSDFISPNNGKDLRFRNSNKLVELNYEIEKWNSNGISYVWVQVDSLNSNGCIYAMWGNNDWNETPPYTTNGAVWSENYVGVWHLNNSNSVGQFTDSLGVNNGDNVQTINAAGIIADAQQFDGNDDYIEIENESNFDLSPNMTVSAWIKVYAFDTEWQAIVAKGEDPEWRITRQAATDFTHFSSAGSFANGSINVNDGQWHLVNGTLDGSATRIYIDGFQDAVNYSVGTGNGPHRVRIGANPSNGRYFQGVIDEVRISSIARSANWLWAFWLNVASNDTFSCYGDVGKNGDAPFIDITNSDETVTYSITNYSIGGTNNAVVAGIMSWTNSLGGYGTLSVASPWEINSIPLTVGNNIITVSGTNIYGQSTNDAISIQRKTLIESAPQIATNTLMFPEANSVIYAGSSTNITWDVNKITDDIDGTNLTISKITLLYADTTNQILSVTNNIENALSEIEWYVTPGNWDGKTNYVLKFEVVNSSSLTNSRIFWDNKFALVPEMGILFSFLFCFAFMLRKIAGK